MRRSFSPKTQLRVRQMLLHLRDKILSAALETVVLVKACRRWGQENNVPRLGVLDRAGDRDVHRATDLGLDPQFHGELRRLAPDHIGFAYCLQRF